MRGRKPDESREVLPARPVQIPDWCTLRSSIPPKSLISEMVAHYRNSTCGGIVNQTSGLKSL